MKKPIRNAGHDKNRRTAAPRLVLRKRKERTPTYVIFHGSRKQVYTGTSELSEAEEHLARYLKSLKQEITVHSVFDTKVDAVLSYAGPKIARQYKSDESGLVRRTLVVLNKFWKGRTIGEIHCATCEEYTAHRRKTRANGKMLSSTTVRIELQIFSQCVKEFCRDHEILCNPSITLPPRDLPRRTFATRSEIARLLRAIRNQRWDAKLLQTQTHSDGTIKKMKVFDIQAANSVARFVLLSTYTATRCTATLKAGWIPNPRAGHIGFDDKMFYRRGDKERKTRKRQPPVKLFTTILGHLRRWSKTDLSKNYQHLFHDAEGRRLSKNLINWRLERACISAGLDWITAHTLRHTSITWALEGGAPLEAVADFAGCTIIEIERTYGEVNTPFALKAAEGLARFGRL